MSVGMFLFIGAVLAFLVGFVMPILAYAVAVIIVFLILYGVLRLLIRAGA